MNWFIALQFLIVTDSETIKIHDASHAYGTYYSEQECKSEGIRRAKEQAEGRVEFYPRVYPGAKVTYTLECTTTPQQKFPAGR